jgi:hypothetical protein
MNSWQHSSYKGLRCGEAAFRSCAGGPRIETSAGGVEVRQKIRTMWSHMTAPHGNLLPIMNGFLSIATGEGKAAKRGEHERPWLWGRPNQASISG